MATPETMTGVLTGQVSGDRFTTEQLLAAVAKLKKLTIPVVRYWCYSESGTVLYELKDGRVIDHDGRTVAAIQRPCE